MPFKEFPLLLTKLYNFVYDHFNGVSMHGTHTPGAHVLLVCLFVCLFVCLLFYLKLINQLITFNFSL